MKGLLDSVELYRWSKRGYLHLAEQDFFSERPVELVCGLPDLFTTEIVEDRFDSPTSALLIVEVGLRTARFDRETKARMYACAKVDEYWVVDLNTRTVIVRRDRADIGWKLVLTFQPGQTISPTAFPDLAIAVADILPELSGAAG